MPVPYHDSQNRSFHRENTPFPYERRLQILVASTQLISPVSRQAIGFAAGRGVEKTASFAAILSLAIKLAELRQRLNKKRSRGDFS